VWANDDDENDNDDKFEDSGLTKAVENCQWE
jgi:hypothetical protein